MTDADEQAWKEHFAGNPDLIKRNPDEARRLEITLTKREERHIKRQLADCPEPLPLREKVANKYHAQRTEYNGVTYDSKREAEYAAQLDLRVAAGEVLYWLPQVPIPLPGKVKYRVDFLEFWRDGSHHWFDVKGVKTPMYRLKKKQVEEIYPIRIEER